MGRSVLVLIALLTGCSTPGAMREIIQSWEGATSEEAVRQLGPARSQKIGSAEFYTWNLWGGQTLNYAYGRVFASDTGCELTLEADPAGKIRGGSYRGNPCCNTTAGSGACNALLRRR